ncbi:MAG: hypothetical protein ACRDQ0_14800 [Pseudonocardia sp.]
MRCVDRYGLALTGSAEAVPAYNRGVGALLRVQTGALEGISASITRDPTFALGHAALALLGHEFCAPVNIPARLRDAELHARRGTARERSHVHAVVRHIQGDSGPLVRHLEQYPRDALLLSIAVPTIAFAGVTTVPEESWAIVERAAPAYGEDWWFSGLLAFIRQEQRRFDEAMDLSCRSLSEEPAAGHSAHARAHAHYETGDHEAGLSWLDGWIARTEARVDNLSHYAWHAALHELSVGDLDAVRRRYRGQLAPPHVIGFRSLVDAGSLLWRWGLTPGAADVPDVEEVLRAIDRDTVEHPPTPFMAMHAAVVLCANDDVDGLRRLAEWSARREHPVFAGVVAPLAAALRRLALSEYSIAADRLAALQGEIWRLGGSDAQREVVEETRLAALLRAGRYDDARALIDERLDRRHCRRDEWFAAQVSPV